MDVAAWILVFVLAYLALGGFVGSAFDERPARPRPPLDAVRDERLDIRPALDRGRRLF